jgi:hypothetical protein
MDQAVMVRWLDTVSCERAVSGKWSSRDVASAPAERPFVLSTSCEFDQVLSTPT